MPSLSWICLGVGDDVVPGRRRALRVEPGALEDLGVPDAAPWSRCWSGCRRSCRRTSPTSSRRARSRRSGSRRPRASAPGSSPWRQTRRRRGSAAAPPSGAALPRSRGAQLVEQLVVVDVLVVGLDVRVGRLPGRPELLVHLAVDVGRGVGRAGLPDGEPALVVERHDLGAFGGGVDRLGAGDAPDVFRRPLRQVDALRPRRRVAVSETARLSDSEPLSSNAADAPHANSSSRSSSQMVLRGTGRAHVVRGLRRLPVTLPDGILSVNPGWIVH